MVEEIHREARISCSHPDIRKYGRKIVQISSDDWPKAALLDLQHDNDGIWVTTTNKFFILLSDIVKNLSSFAYEIQKFSSR